MTTTAYAVTGVLDRRERELENRLLGRCVAAAVILHLAGAGAAWLIPRLTRQPPKPIEYVAIQIVPAARLGVEKPPAPKPEPPKPEPAKPEPPKPEPKAEAPVLPKLEKGNFIRPTIIEDLPLSSEVAPAACA